MISILIPAYNEASRIAATIAAARTLSLPGQPVEIVVVDDGSTDSTSRIAEQAGADVIFRQPNQGKGAALERAFALSQGSTLLLLDADLGETATEAISLLRPVVSGTADMTIATFPVIPGKGGGMGFVVRLARWGIRKLTGQTMQAPLSGQRAIRRDLLMQIGGFASGWGVEIALTVQAFRAGFRILEIPTQMTHHVTGRNLSGIRHRLRQFLAAARILLQLRSTPTQNHDGSSKAKGIHRDG